MKVNIQIMPNRPIHQTERRANNLIMELESLSEISGNESTLNGFNLLNEVLRSASGLAASVKSDFSNPIGNGVLADTLRDMRKGRIELKIELAKLADQVARGKSLIAESKQKALTRNIG